jgi:hypothetical protein
VKKGKGVVAKCDRMFSELVRSIGRCQARDAHRDKLIDWHPRCAGNLETSHCLSRRYSFTRTLPANALCLCSGAHRYVTANPQIHYRLVVAICGEGHWEYLRAEADRGLTEKFDWPKRAEELATMLERRK